MMLIGRSMRSSTRTAVALVAIVFGTLFAACGDNDVDTEATQDTVERAANNAREEAESAFATLRTEAERLMDELQTRNASQAKERLLEQCRDVLERLRRAESDQAGRVDRLCNRIRETDPSNSSVWNEVRDEIAKLPQS